jgi:hypothetical protein
MSLVSFGQPDDGIIQMAYVVEDLHKAIEEWVSKLKVGPWFVLDRLEGEDKQYRGQPSHADITLAMSFAGHMNIELLQQRNDAPSVYREVVSKRGYGFHHWGIGSWHYDQDVERYRNMGYELAFSLRVPSGGRVAYFDTTANLPGMVELLELGASFEPIFNRFYRASIGWDGSDPVRSFL